MRFLSLCVILPFSASHYLPAAVVEGTVCDESKHPVLSARVRVYNGAKLLTSVPEPVSLQGKYRISLPTYQGDRVTLEVDAPGYSSAKVTVVLPANGTPIEAIVLRQQPGLVLGQLQEKESPDHKVQILAGCGKRGLDHRKTVLVERRINNLQRLVSAEKGFFRNLLEVSMTNAAASPVTVTGVSVLASAQPSIDCADKSPGIISTIRQKGSELVVRISVLEEYWQEEEALAGKVEILPCGVTRLHLSFPVMWTFPGQKTDKLLVQIPMQIPMQITVPDGTSKRTMNLKEMRTLVVRLVDDHQQTKDSKLQRENR
jgi:hypothetical protein